MQIWRLKRVVEETGLSRSTIYAYVKDGKFPKQVHLTQRTAGWVASEVEEWIRERVERRS